MVCWTGFSAPYIPQSSGDYVVYFAGSEQPLGVERFRCGRRCTYRVDMSGGVVEETGGQFGDGLGCGPRLVANGRVVLTAQDEGFRDPKILTSRSNRSAIGYPRDRRTLIMFTSGSATMRGLAEAARALGLYDAMNLDGGASSGLWFDGRYLVTPGREIPNALVVLQGKAG